MVELSPAYEAFHIWLRSNRALIAAGKDKTVTYSGKTGGGVGLWKKLPERAEEIKVLFGVDPEWTPIQFVLEKLKVNLGSVAKASPRLDHFLPSQLYQRISMWDFACNASRRKWMTLHENQQVWLNLSAWYVRNAKGRVWIFMGKQLKEFPDLLLTEIPTLMKNGRVDEVTMQRAIHLAPKSQANWEKFRTKEQGQRTEGRR